MRTPSLSSVAYQPGQVPSDTQGLPAFLKTELDRLAAVIQLLAAGHIDRSHVAPIKPRDGDVRIADGTSWNPGSGRGLYYYDDSVPGWVFVA